jgi:hypothetical protein
MFRQVLVSAVVAVVALAGYHVALRPEPARETVAPEDLAALLRRIEALEASVPSAEAPRLSGLSDAPTPAAGDPPPPGLPATPASTVPVSAPMSEEESERRRAADALDYFRTRVRAAGPTLTEAAVEEAAALLAGHAESLRLLQMEIAAATPAERADLARREEGLRIDLDAALAEVLPAQVREALGPPKRPR